MRGGGRLGHPLRRCDLVVRRAAGRSGGYPGVVQPLSGHPSARTVEQGRSAAAALDTVVQGDSAPHGRQLGIVDMAGGSVAWTGRDCLPWAGHRTGDGYAIQGNLLPGEHVLEMMERAFVAARGRDLSDRLVASLQAGETAGGERRGKQSAAVLVFASDDYPWLDVRIDDHARPVDELRRVHDIAVLQLTPFIREMPQRGRSAVEVSAETRDLLALSPPARPGGGGAR